MTVDGFELVAKAKNKLLQVPLVDQLKVCGNVILAPEDGLLKVAVQGTVSVNDLQLDRA